MKLYYQRRKKGQTTKSTQESLNFKKMYASGVIEMHDHVFSKTIEFSDISYQLSNDEEKRRLFNLYCTLLNSFDPTVHVQFSFINTHSLFEEEIRTHTVASDSFAQQRQEYFDFIAEQRAKGNNGIIRRKYLTFSVREKNYRNALRRLTTIESSVQDLFRNLGVVINPLSGVERLEVVNHLMNFNQKGYLNLGSLSDDIFKQGLEKDYLAPLTMDFHISKSEERFTLNKKHGMTLYFNVSASELSDRVLVDFLDLEKELLVSLHMSPVDQQKAVKMVKGKASDLKASKIEENKKALSRGYDMDILPAELNQNIDETERIVKDLQQENERFFFLTFTVTAFEDTLQALENTVFSLKALAQKHNCELLNMGFQQEQAFLSALPFGYNLNEPDFERGLTTTSTAVFVPFTTLELYQEDKDPVYYGLNALSNNLIQVSRKALKNPNGLFLGTPGSGKSFSAKREMIDVFLSTQDDIIITDPEGEYAPFVQLLQGQVVTISLDAQVYINPLDITSRYGEGSNPVAYKSDFVLSMMNLIVGNKDGLTGKQMSLVDKAVRQVYLRYIDTQNPEDIPILEDLYNKFLEYEEPEAKELADALELYVHGSLNVFNHRTNVNYHNRLICFNIKQLGANLKDLGMLILQDHVWNKVTANQQGDVHTWYYMDEFHKLLADPQTAQYSVDFWKRFRKYAGIPTGITQNVQDLLSTKTIETILENSDFIYLLNQASGDRRTLQDKLDISDYEATYITNSSIGEGLLIYNGIIVPFKDKFPKNNSLYPVMTTNVDELRELRSREGGVS